MDIAAVRDALAEALRGGEDRVIARRIDRLRREFPDDVTALIAASVTLRRRARRKLGEGDWLVSDRGLQQATPWQVARLKAFWLKHSPVHDLACGIGGDAMALAARGRLVAIDRDPMMGLATRCNLVAAGKSGDVVIGDVRDVVPKTDTAVHIDPDRRDARGRLTRPEDLSPAWSAIEPLLHSAPAGLVKLAPATSPGSTAGLTQARVWISLRKRVREQTLLTGEAIAAAGLTAGARAAAVINGQGVATNFTAAESETAEASDVNEVGDWLVDPDAAIRAAGLTSAFAVRQGLRLLGGPSGFLTGGPSLEPDRLGDLAVVGSVIYRGSADDRKLRRELRRRDAYPAVVKVRGTEHRPEVLTRRYRSCGSRPLTLWIGRGPKRIFAALTAEPNEPV